MKKIILLFIMILALSGCSDGSHDKENIPPVIEQPEPVEDVSETEEVPQLEDEEPPQTNEDIIEPEDEPQDEEADEISQPTPEEEADDQPDEDEPKSFIWGQSKWGEGIWQ